MNRNPFGNRFVRAAAVAIGAMCAAVSANAQQADAGPYGNLFGAVGKPQTQSLDLRGGLFGGYDDTPLAQAPNGGDNALFDPRFQEPGATSGFNAAASYRYGHSSQGRSGSHVGFGAIASVQEFSGGSSKPFWSPSYGVDTSFGTHLTPKIEFSAGAILSYAPYYQYAPFLTGGPAIGGAASTNNVVPADVAGPDEAASAEGSVPTGNQPAQNVSPVGTDLGFASQSEFVGTLNTSASITDNFTRRSALSLSGAFNTSAIVSGPRIDTAFAEVRISHKLAKKVGVHFGVGLQNTRYTQDSAPSGHQTLNHFIDFGIDYGDGGSISFKRYYTLSFSVGTSAVQRDGDTAFQLDGSTQLARRIGRTWVAYVGVARGTSYMLGLTEPFFSDSASAGFGGQIVPRLNLSGGAFYMHGHPAFSDSAQDLVSKSASTKLSFGLNRHIGLYAQYSYYQYNAPNGLLFTVGIPPSLKRRSATAGLSVWAPLINPRTPRTP